MNRYRQRGMATLYLILIMVAVIGALGSVIYFERKALLTKIDDLNREIAADRETIQNLKDANLRLMEEARGLNKTIGLMETIAKETDAERLKREGYLRIIDDRFRTISNKLPNGLSDAQVCKPTDEQLKNSAARIDYIWSVYGLDYRRMVTP